MPNYIFPNIAAGDGKLRREIIQSEASITMGTANNPRTEVDIPALGDLVALEVELTQSTTGTLTTAGTLDAALAGIAIKDVRGTAIWNSIRGSDLPLLDRVFNIGRSRTVPTTSGTAQTHRWLLPFNIELADMPARIQVTIAPYSAMAASGATGGSVTYNLVAYYQDKSNIQVTQRLSRITQTIVSGLNRFGPNLPKQTLIQHLLFSVGTESNITSVNFSSDGAAELREITPSDLTGIDDVRLVSGHVTGQFSLYNSPFVSTTKSILDVTGAGSDTVQWYVITATEPGKSA